jgi:hypothetical protein
MTLVFNSSQFAAGSWECQLDERSEAAGLVLLRHANHGASSAPKIFIYYFNYFKFLTKISRLACLLRKEEACGLRRGAWGSRGVSLLLGTQSTRSQTMTHERPLPGALTDTTARGGDTR